MENDRVLHHDIEAARRLVESNATLDAVEKTLEPLLRAQDVEIQRSNVER